MAKVHRDSGALGRAEISARKALELDPMNAVALGLMGDIALRCGRWEEATRYLEQALFFSPVDTHAAELLKLARHRTQPPVAARLMQPPPEPEPVPAPPQPAAPPREESGPQSGTDKNLTALRQMPGVEGALLLTAEGLPVSGSLGKGNETDEDIAALAAGLVGEWARSNQMPPCGPQGLAMLEADGGQLVLATTDGWILLVAVSGHMRLGRVLGDIRRIADQIGSAGN
jgi:predicted regulator of Ras-like GTPase activity (Roadblock/LC7/MglB family)